MGGFQAPAPAPVSAPAPSTAAVPIPLGAPPAVDPFATPLYRVPVMAPPAHTAHDFDDPFGLGLSPAPAPAAAAGKHVDPFADLLG